MRGKWAIISLVASVIFLVGVFLGSACLIPVPAQSSRSDSSKAGLDTVEQAWNVIFQNYVDEKKLDSRKLAQGAIRGMLSALDDPYTSYLDPESFSSAMHELQADYQGIGAYVGSKENQTIILGTMPDTPAQKAGLTAGDKILAVDGKSTEGLDIESVARLIRGPADTTVTVTIQHQASADKVEVTLTRSRIVIKTVNWEMKDDIAYVRITQFSDPTDGEFDDAVSGIIEQQEKGNAKGLILDLRSNPGGRLDSVAGIASHFFDSGVVVYVVDKDGKRTELKANAHKAQVRMPVMVLVDEFSASGSEVLSGALRDRVGAKLAGHKTFGKGSVNQFKALPDGGAIYMTISHWETPNGTLIEGKGLQPDLLTDLHGNDLVNSAIDYLHQVAAGNPSPTLTPVPAG